MSGKIKSDGGSSSYYRMKVLVSKDEIYIHKSGLVEVTLETGDVIKALVDNDFDLGNTIKAVRRIHQASKGLGKEGTSVGYDCNKIKYFIDNWKKNYDKETLHATDDER